VLELVNRRVYSAEDLIIAIDLPVLAIISSATPPLLLRDSFFRRKCAGQRCSASRLNASWSQTMNPVSGNNTNIKLSKSVDSVDSVESNIYGRLRQPGSGSET